MSQVESERFAAPLLGLEILLVDDCPDQLRLYTALLTREGAAVSIERDGLAAVDNVTRSPDRYDLILADLEMPRMTGIEATRELRERGIDVPVLGMTVRGTVALEREWWHAGCDGYLRKPFTRDTLVRQILALIRPRPNAVVPSSSAAPTTSASTFPRPSSVGATVESHLGDDSGAGNATTDDSSMPTKPKSSRPCGCPDGATPIAPKMVRARGGEPLGDRATERDAGAIDRAIRKLMQTPEAERDSKLPKPNGKL